MCSFCQSLTFVLGTGENMVSAKRIKRTEINKDCQNDRVPSLLLFYLHAVSYIFYYILLFLCAHFSSQSVPIN